MARFAQKQVKTDKVLNKLNQEYQLGHNDKIDYAYKAKKGLSQLVVRQLSARKKEPAWMLDKRLAALEIYDQKPLPTWGGNLKEIDFKEIYYYLESMDHTGKTWDDVPDAIKKTFDKIGVPEAERKFLAGVGGQYDSTVVYHNLLDRLKKKGVVFLGMDDGLKQYPKLVKEYFSKIIPAGDNKLAALNTATWSGGSFIYVPKGVDVDLPLQAYFRINAEKAGQFERTLIIADEGSKVHYVEGCFIKGTSIRTDQGYQQIELIKTGDKVASHKGVFRKVYKTQKRKHSGLIYDIEFYGDSTTKLTVTDEHPFLFAKRAKINDRNKTFNLQWGKPGELKIKDYLAMPRLKTKYGSDSISFKIIARRGKSGPKLPLKIKLPLTKDLFKFIGYYLAEGSCNDRGYVRFSFGSQERTMIEEVKKLANKVYPTINKIHEFGYQNRKGTEVNISSVELARIMAHFGKKANKKALLPELMTVDDDLLIELLKSYFAGDGNYYHKKHQSGFKELLRMNTVSKALAYQIRDILAKLGIAAFINARNRSKEGRQAMYTVGISGDQMIKFGRLVGLKISDKINGHQRASMFGADENYIYLPIKSIKKRKATDLTVYNFSVEKDESYLAGGVAVHNCSAPQYSSGSLHSAVVEIFVKKGARVQYTTLQNWYKNVYNLVTKRAWVEEEAEMLWIDVNMGSRLTMKYPSCILAGRKAKGETLSVALAAADQHQDAGAKMIHLAPETTSRIISKSISKDGGRATYRGMVQINKGAYNSRSKVVCDALILDEKSRSDTYPTNKIMENRVTLEHEATVSKVGEEQLFYLMSRGMEEHEAEAMIVQGFLEPVVKEIPMEYAVEMNRLIELEMEGSVG
jgi:Fe-S cluster assembly protein SufB